MKVPVYKYKENLKPLNAPMPSVDNVGFQALSKAGEAISGVGETILKIHQLDTADVINAYALYRDQSREKLNELVQKRGRDARTVVQEYDDWSQKTKAEFLEKQLSNKAQKIKFQGLIENLRAHRLDYLSNYQRQENDNYIRQTSKQIYNDTKKEVTSNPFDDKGREDALDHYAASIIDLYPGENVEPVIEETEAEIKTAALIAMINQDPERAKSYLEDWKDEIGPKLYSQLKQKRKQAIKDTENEALILTKQEEKQLKKDQEKVANEFDKKIDTLTMQEVEGSILSPGNRWGEKDYYRQKIRSRAEKIKKENVDPYTQFDPVVKADIQKRVNTEPETVTNEDIWEPVGKGKKGGLTSAQAEALQKRRDTNLASKDKTKRISQAYKLIDNFQRKYIFSSNDKNNIMDAQSWRDALDEFVDNNPDEDPVKWLEDQFNEISNSWYGRLWDRIMTPFQEKTTDKRTRAIQILKQNGKIVNEETIKIVMEQL